MPDRPFRFGVVAVPRGGRAWLTRARQVADLGYTSLLTPDVIALPAPLPSLALVAGATALRVGTHVLAATLRPPRSAAWEAHSMTVLTEGRFELGIGAGLPSTREVAASFGLPYGSPAERLARVEETIDRLRELDGEVLTPVLVAAGGPRARDLAARRADIVTLAAGPLTSAAETRAMADDLWARAGSRADRIELATNLLAAGQDIDPAALPYGGPELGRAVLEQQSLVVLPGTTQEMADELRRRRDELGLSYVCINDTFAEALAPVVESLAGT